MSNQAYIEQLRRRLTQARYENLGAEGLPFEYEACYEAGLSFPVAERIEFCACGMGAVVDHLIAQKPQEPDDVDKYVKSIGCWGDGSSESIMNGLYQHLGCP